MRRLHPGGDPTADLTDDDLLAAYAIPPGTGPHVRANFVSSADGAASLDGVSGGLSSPADKRVFGLLRDLADVVLVGAGTLRTENYGYPEYGQRRRARRRDLGLAELPTFAVVSGSLDLDPGSRFFKEARVRPLVLTTAAAAAQAAGLAGAAGLGGISGAAGIGGISGAAGIGGISGAAGIGGISGAAGIGGISGNSGICGISGAAEIIPAGDVALDLVGALDLLAGRGLRRVLCEGGPTLFGHLAATGALDELCLTLAPVLAGAGPGRISAGPPHPPLGMALRHLLAEDGALFLRYAAVHPGAEQAG